MAYCIASSEAVASFVVERAPLDALATLAAQRRVVVLVPSADVRLTAVALPARQAAKALQAVPFALEDQLADDVDTLHFALGSRRSDGSWPVAVVAHTRMQHWLQQLTEAGVRPDAIIPDVLALPVPDEQQFSLLIDGAEVVARTGPDASFVCERDDLPLCLQLADADKSRTLRIVIPRDQAFDPSTLEWPVEPLHGFADPLEALLQQLDLRQSIDLLQGPYSARQDWLRYWKPWRLAAGLAGAAFVLGLIAHGIEVHRLGGEVAALEARNVARYQELFPDEVRIEDLGSQLAQKLSSLSGGDAGPAFFPLLDVVSRAIGEVQGLEVEALQYRDSALYVGLSASNLQVLEKLKQWFEKPGTAALEVQSANAGSQGVKIRIRLTL